MVQNESPTGTAYVTASVVGNDGTVLFDDVEITNTITPDTVTYDISSESHDFLGFGAHIWGYGPDATYPNLLNIRQQCLSELNIKYIRIENYAESASWSDMQATRAMTDTLGIKWVYMVWIGPGAYMDGGGMLNDIPGFGTWWAFHVNTLYDNSIPVEYIELMNEPDSGGAWSTGITYSDYNLLVKDLRPKLDALGYNNVGIVGAGPADIWKCDDYIYALDPTGVASMAAWSTHSWGSADGPESESRCVTNLKIPGDAVDSTLPKFVTEYATHETSYHGVTTEPGDAHGGWSLTDVFPYYATMNRIPYGVRTYENTLGLLNGGAQVPFVWQAIDEPTEVGAPGYYIGKYKAWGLLDLWGNPKPVYGQLKTLYPEIPIGSKVITSPSQSANITYTGTTKSGNRIVIGATNETSNEHTNTITLTNAPEDLKISRARGFEPFYWGNTANGDPDIGIEVARTFTLNEITPTQYTIDANLPGDSTLTIILTVKPDLDEDGDVDYSDLDSMTSGWLQAGSTADIAPDGGDNTVDLKDFALFAKHFLTQ